MNKDLHKLSNRMGAELDGGNVILYDIQAHPAKRLAAITAGEMSDLRVFYDAGLCPVCLEEIAECDIICDECLENARNMRRLAR
jgi:hypothetical protein